jgi:cysteine-rich repeat protein
MPIGAGARYVPARIQPGVYGLFAEEDLLILSPNAPLVNVIAHDADWDPNRKRCDSIVSPTKVLFTGAPIPAAFSTEPDHTGDTPNHSAAILMPDGLTIRNTQPLHRCGASGAVVSQYNFPDDNIKTGDGIIGAHGGSSMSSMGGVIRLGELQPNSTLRHALKIVLDSQQYVYYNANDATPGYRWPALWADVGAATGYGGQEPAFEMGALLALKPDFAVDNLRTEPAKIVARALRDYGGYVVDSAGWDAYYLTVEWGPNGRFLDEFAQTWGFPFLSPQPASCTNTADAACRWSKDMGDIFTSLHVVANNGPQSIGGPGVRRQPCAPPFSDGSGAAPEYCARSGNQPSAPNTTVTPTSTSTPIPSVTPIPTRAAVCGNGLIEAAEACDDGNRVSGDGCTNQCVVEQSCYDPGNTFSFFTWSDSYGSAGDGGVMRLFKDAVNRTLYPNRVLPRFWVAAGDVPYVPGIEQFSIEALNDEISGANYPFTCAASNRTFPLFVALGNHDVDGDAAQIATKFAYWRDQIGQRLDKTLVGIQNFRLGPDNGYDARTTYSFDYKNAHFVVVNQYYGDPTYPNYATANPLACIRPSMYDWIDQDLANTTRPIKFVLGHAPAWSYCSQAPGSNGCINYGNNFIEDLLDPGKRPRSHAPSGQAWLEAYGRHWGDSLENAKCPALNGQEGRSVFWSMLAKHKVTAHLVGHTHTYSSRLVDADGARNDTPLTQAERNRRAYGKNGDVFSTADGVWEVDSGMTHNSAGSVYVLVTVRNNRVSFEAWDQMGANENEEPYRLVEHWHVDVAGVAPPATKGAILLPLVSR